MTLFLVFKANRRLKCVTVMIVICILATSCSKSGETYAVTEPTENTIISRLESNQQWYLRNDGTLSEFNSANSWESDERTAQNDIDIDYFEGMEIYSEKRTTIVAVIDTDIDADLFYDTDNLWVNEAELPDDGIDNDGNGYIDDIHGWDFCTQSSDTYADTSTTTHGNSIVGILVGCCSLPEYTGMLDETNNQVMLLKAVDEKVDGNIQLLIEAIDYAEKKGASICCLALSTYSNDSDLLETIKNSSMLFVVAAGNDGVELGTDIMCYPAMYQLDNIVTVADVRCDGKISKMSNYSDQYVDVFAPGTDIICVANQEGYEFVSGSSVATSIVTGVCALVRSSWSEELSPDELKQLLINSSKKEVNSEETMGEGGIVSLYKCLAN